MSAGIVSDASGLTRAQKRAALLEMQDGRCACCMAESPRCADHDHDTGLLRGLLCRGCNRREGNVRVRGVSHPDIDAYVASPPAAGLGWIWDLPDWWDDTDTREARRLNMTALEYVTSHLSARLAHRDADRAAAVTVLAAADARAAGRAPAARAYLDADLVGQPARGNGTGAQRPVFPVSADVAHADRPAAAATAKQIVDPDRLGRLVPGAAGGEILNVHVAVRKPERACHGVRHLNVHGASLR